MDENQLLSNGIDKPRYLKQVATLPVYSDSGQRREIQLCVGDVTALSTDNQVDVILVSAFYQSYTPTPGTVIRALYRFGLSVEKLAKDKAGDLRSPFNCWWSKPLPATLPYRQLLCFETSNAISHAAKQVNNVFRCLMVICKTSGTSVITPLLSTGNQCADKGKMLSAIIDGAVHWMKAGIPLTTLKIVLYDSGRPALSSEQKDINDCLQVFNELKAKYEPFCKLPESHSLLVDFYISHSDDDSGVADDLMVKLQGGGGGGGDVVAAAGSSVNVSSTKRSQARGVSYDEERVWQQQMYDNMAQCHVIITLLTSSYMSSPVCIEEYNIALCLMQNKSLRPSRMLAPWYLQRVADIPAYMTSIQWLDCKDYDEGKLDDACKQLLGRMTPLSHYQSGTDNTDTDVMNAAFAKANAGNGLGENKDSVVVEDNSRDLQLFRQLSIETKYYDVFISYAHKDGQMANRILDALRKSKPHLRIFFDKEELKTGMLWQHTMFEGTENCTCMLAIITNNYLNSLVCSEELCVGIARAIMTSANLNDPFHLQLLYIDDSIESFPDDSSNWLINFPSERIILSDDDKPEEIETRLQHLIEKITSLPSVESSPVPSLDPFSEEDEHDTEISVSDILSVYRNSQALDYLRLLDGQQSGSRPLFKERPIQATSIDDTAGEENHVDVVYLFSKSEETYVTYLNELVCERLGGAGRVRTSLDAKYENMDVLHLLDITNYIVILVSCNYILSSKLMQQLHVALIKARKVKCKRDILYLIQIDKLPQQPFFLHLLDYGTVCHDKIWSDIPSHEYYMVGDMAQASAYLAFDKACHDICNMMTSDSPQRSPDVDRWKESYGMLLNISTVVTMMSTEDEQHKLAQVKRYKKYMPQQLSKLINDGKLQQLSSSLHPRDHRRFILMSHSLSAAAAASNGEPAGVGGDVKQPTATQPGPTTCWPGTPRWMAARVRRRTKVCALL